MKLERRNERKICAWQHYWKELEKSTNCFKSLKALNSSVVVEKEEYDEVVAIKPMFLVMDYK